MALFTRTFLDFRLESSLHLVIEPELKTQLSLVTRLPQVSGDVFNLRERKILVKWIGIPLLCTHVHIHTHTHTHTHTRTLYNHIHKLPPP